MNFLGVNSGNGWQERVYNPAMGIKTPKPIAFNFSGCEVLRSKGRMNENRHAAKSVVKQKHRNGNAIFQTVVEARQVTAWAVGTAAT